MGWAAYLCSLCDTVKMQDSFFSTVSATFLLPSHMPAVCGTSCRALLPLTIIEMRFSPLSSRLCAFPALCTSCLSAVAAAAFPGAIVATFLSSLHAQNSPKRLLGFLASVLAASRPIYDPRQCVAGCRAALALFSRCRRVCAHSSPCCTSSSYS